MSITLHPKDALLSAARESELPLAFIVGSPLSQDSRGGVPNVSGFLDIIKGEVRSKLPSKVASFEKLIEDTPDIIAYQRAMSWLHGYFTQDGVKRVVDQAVRMSRKPGAPARFQGDGDPTSWHIPKGTRELAKLVTSGDEHFAGPILTTNFDPLIPLAIREAGGQATIRVVDSDGDLHSPVDEQPDLIHVIYLHGYWRVADTLHTLTQLTHPRPRLRSSLQDLFRRHTVFVVAYGGWDDVFTTAIEEILESNDATFNILWCFYEDEALVVQSRYAPLLKRVRNAIIKGRFAAYGGVDCHSIFGELAGNSDLFLLDPSSSEGESSRTSSASTRETIAEFAHAMSEGAQQVTSTELGRMYREAVRTWIDRLVHATQEGNKQAIVELLNEEMATTPELLTDRTRPELVSKLCNLETGKVVFLADLLLDISADVKEREWLRFWDAYIMSTHRLIPRYRDMDVMLQLNGPVKRWIDSAPDATTKGRRSRRYSMTDNEDGP